MRNSSMKTALACAGTLAVLLVIGNFLGCTYDPVGRYPLDKAKTILSNRSDFTQKQKDDLIYHVRLPIEVLRDFMKIESSEVHCAVAGNPSVDLAMFEELILDPVQQVRQAVATNPMAPHSILVQLLNDRDANVRHALPGNPNWPSEELRRMYLEGKNRTTTDTDNRILPDSAFARNPSTPTDVLDSIALTGKYGSVQVVARNPSLSHATMQRLAQHADASVRAEIAKNPQAPRSILQGLVSDSDPKVREGIAGNPHTPFSMLDALATDTDPKMLSWIASIRAMRTAKCKRKLISAEDCKLMEQ